MKVSRRDFLGSVAASTLALGIPIGPVKAWIHGSEIGTPKVQVDTAFPEPSAFKNFMSSFGSVQSSGGYAFPSVLNVDQYPVGTIAADIFGAALLPSNLTSGTTLVLAWTGVASGGAFGAMGITLGSPGFTVTVGGGFVVGGTSNNLFVAGTNGYIEFNFNGAPPASLSFSFKSGSTFTGLTGLIICAKSDYASIIAATDAGQLITSAYINSFKGLRPKRIRAMPWTDPDDANNFTQHKYRMNWQTALSYTKGWIPNCWAGTSSGTNSYTANAATDTPGGYTLGEVLQLQFVNASTSTPITINVGSRGVVPLLDISGNALASNAIAANALATLIYDDILAGYLVTFTGMTCNVPVEVQVGLANQVGCPLWYSFPPHITNTSVTQIATLIGNTINAGCAFEYANEVWNFAGGFQQTSWAVNCGTALGFPSGNNRQFHGFYGLKIAQIMPLVTAAWRAKNGLKCIMAYQAFGTIGTGGDINVYRLKGSDLSTGLGYTLYNSYVGVSYNVSPNRPVDVCDALSYATYYSGAQCANFDASYKNVGGTGLTTGGPASGAGSALSGLLGAADAFASGDTANAIAWLDWDIRQGTNNGTAGGQTLLALNSGANSGAGIYAPWETVAASYDGARPSGKANLEIILYEGSMESSALSTSRCTVLSVSTTYGGAGGKIDNLLTAYKKSATFSATVQQQFNDFFAASQSSGRTLTACWSFLTGGSQWAMYQLPGDVYSQTWQSYSAVASYNRTP